MENRVCTLAAIGVFVCLWAMWGRTSTLAADGAPAADPPALGPMKYENSVGMTLVRLSPGQFTMGSPDNEAGRDSDETAHQVTLSRPFYISNTLVTQAQWLIVMNSDPSRFLGYELPVDSVTWSEAVLFCERLSVLEHRVYRLPTEAEWEYACRAGTTGAYNVGDASTLTEAAWFADNSGGRTHCVGGKKPNAWGLYDMHGDVWEWCYDLYGDYPEGSVLDPTGPTTGDRRVCRGGSWDSASIECRSAARNDLNPNQRYPTVGFRVVMEGN